MLRNGGPCENGWRATNHANGDEHLGNVGGLCQRETLQALIINRYVRSGACTLPCKSPPEPIPLAHFSHCRGRSTCPDADALELPRRLFGGSACKQNSIAKAAKTKAPARPDGERALINAGQTFFIEKDLEVESSFQPLCAIEAHVPIDPLTEAS